MQAGEGCHLMRLQPPDHAAFGLQGAALNLAGTTGAAAVAFAKARQDEGPSALLQQIEREDSSGTIRKVYERIKVPVHWQFATPAVSCWMAIHRPSASDKNVRMTSEVVQRSNAEYSWTDHTVERWLFCVQGVIDSGSLAQQTAVITVLRIVPFAPFRCCLLLWQARLSRVQPAVLSLLHP
jgi:hypothetical protein